MSILIPTMGTRGDVQPYVALAQGLVRAGVDVIVATHPAMRDVVVSHGVPFTPIGPDVDIGEQAARIRGDSPSWLQGMARTVRLTLRILQVARPDLLPLVADSELVIVPHTGAGVAEADMTGRPWASVTLCPQDIPTRGPERAIARGLLGSPGGAVAASSMYRAYGAMKQHLGAASTGHDRVHSPVLDLVPASSHVVPRDDRWSSEHVQTGFWLLPATDQWEPPHELVDFLAGDRPIIAVTLGAMSQCGADGTAEIIVAALHESGMRAVVQGWNGNLGDLVSNDIMPIGAVPHDWLFDRVDAVVHHAGAGTTATALAARRPSVVIPHMLDQFYWSSHVADLGAAPPPLPRSELTAEALATALRAVVEEPQFADSAARIGEALHAEDGVGDAVAALARAFPAAFA